MCGSRLAAIGTRQFIEQSDRPLLVDGQGVPQWGGMGAHLRDIAVSSADVMPEIGDPLDRVSITLRLWAGCLEAAKRSLTRREAGRIRRLAAPKFLSGLTRFLQGMSCSERVRKQPRRSRRFAATRIASTAFRAIPLFATRRDEAGSGRANPGRAALTPGPSWTGV